MPSAKQAAKKAARDRAGEIARRHYEKRPLAQLTDEELEVLIVLEKVSGLLRDDLSRNLDTLSELANRELDQRIYDLTNPS